MKEIKVILTIAICLFIALFGLYMQFFAKDKDFLDESSKETVILENKAVTAGGNAEETNQEPHQQPVPEDEMEPQTFGNEGLNVYFTQMDEIQNDDTFLPYMGYSDMVPVTVEFLKEQTEIELPEDENIELRLSPGMTYKRRNLISFHCYFAAIDTDLEIEYVYDDSTMEYIDIHFVKKGEWNLKWKK